MRDFNNLILLITIITSLFTSTLMVSTLPISNELMVKTSTSTNTEMRNNEQAQFSVSSETSYAESSINENVAIAAGIIQAYIFDYMTSIPISAANILVFQITEDEQTQIASGETDSLGAFEVGGLEAGSYNVSVEKIGYQTESTIIILRNDQDRIITTIYLSKLPKNSGFFEVIGLNLETNEPLEDATIHVYDSNGSLVTTSSLDRLGFVNITDLAVQSYLLLISMSGYASQIKEVMIDYIGDNDNIKFYLNPIGSGKGFIEIHTMVITGTILTGALVQVYDLTKSLISEDITNAAGFLNITDLEIGTYNVSVSSPDYISQFQITVIDYPDDGDRLNFLLLESTGNGFIYGNVLDENGKPIHDATIEVYSEDLLLLALFTDVNGLYNATNLIIGKEYVIFASAEGYIPDRAYIKLGNEGIAKITQFLRAELGNDGCFEVYIKNSTHFLENAYIEIYDAEGNLLNTYFTNENGFSNITGLRIGNYNLYILKEGYLIETKLSMISFDGDSDELIIILKNDARALPGTGIVDVFVKDESGSPIQDAYVRILGEFTSSFNFTDIEGKIIAKNLFIGKYTITVSKDGYKDTTTSTEVNYVGDIDTVYVTLDPEESSVISLYISLPDKADDQVGVVYVRYQIDNESWSKWIPTDETGRIDLPNTRVGEYNIEVMRNGYETLTQTILVTDIKINVNYGVFLDAHQADGVTEYYALIVAGEYERRFTIDAYAMYVTLKNHYSYTADNMYLLTPRTTHPLSGVPVPYDRITSRLNVQWAINQIALFADADDEVLIWWTGHGGWDAMGTYTDSITANQFDTYLDTIICKEMYIFLGPCHSGSMIDDLSEQNRVIYTSCHDFQGGHAKWEHSYWPWATYRALHILSYATMADKNGDTYISLYEIYEYSFLYILITKGFFDQLPQRWVGSLINDANTFLGDGSYVYGMIEESIAYLAPSEEDIGDFYDGPEDVQVYASVSTIDNELDEDDFAFQAINSSDIHQGLVSEVTINIYFLNGTFYESATTNTSGMLIFYDVPMGEFAWEAIYQGVEVDSGNLISDGYSISVSSYPNNWDLQGDNGDIRFNALESSSYIFVPGVLIFLFKNDGTLLGTCTTDYIGSGFIFDIPDGSYAYEATYNGLVVDEGITVIDSSLFTLETDDIAPIVTIISPGSDDTFIFSEDDIVLQYSVIEKNNYSVNVLLDGISIGFRNNGSIISEINTVGKHVIRVVVTDIAGNTHYDEIDVFVVSLDTTTTESTTTDDTKSLSTPGFEIMIIVTILSLLITSKKYR